MSDSIDDYIPSVLNPRSIRKSLGPLNVTQNSISSNFSLSLKKNVTNCSKITQLYKDSKIVSEDKENFNLNSTIPKKRNLNNVRLEDEETLKLSAIEDINSLKDDNSFSLIQEEDKNSVISLSSATELSISNSDSDETVLYDYSTTQNTSYIVSFAVNKSNDLNISTKNANIKNIAISNINTEDMKIECEIINSSESDTEMGADIKPTKTFALSPAKRPSVAVNLEIKRQKLSQNGNREEKSVLILNSHDVKKLSAVSFQPTNYKIFKQKIQEQSKLIAATRKSNINSYGLRKEGISNLKQRPINFYFAKVLKSHSESDDKNLARSSGESFLTNQDLAQDASHDMSKNLCVATRNDVAAQSIKTVKKNENKPPRKLSHRSMSPRVESKESDFTSPRVKNNRTFSPRQIVDSIQFSLPVKSRSNKTSVITNQTTKVVPHYKIITGTHFAVDAFSYGDIPNVKHYFLTHFHSDHYTGLKKTFSKMLFCSKITADLCISRLGVCVKYIHIMNIDEPIKIDGVEITAVDANHCPGAIMLVFTLPNGKTLLHTGDFRATPIMESYPVFWNKDIHTIYLDTTYCNPRYDFPTQDESLEMALYHLRQKKTALEKAGKKFSSVLIVCGTYTIGKEKFFLGMSRRVGCSVWACPEKDRVLQAVEGRSFSHAPPTSCQLHVVPMRDLTHEKLRSYLDSLQGTFSEVVAFKPSGWENGKNSCVEKDGVTIYGIPYSEHSSFSEMIRFVKFLKPKQVVPTVDVSGGIKAVQKYFPCPVVHKEELQSQARLTDYFSIQSPHRTAVT